MESVKPFIKSWTEPDFLWELLVGAYYILLIISLLILLKFVTVAITNVIHSIVYPTTHYTIKSSSGDKSQISFFIVEVIKKQNNDFYLRSFPLHNLFDKQTFQTIFYDFLKPYTTSTVVDRSLVIQTTSLSPSPENSSFGGSTYHLGYQGALSPQVENDFSSFSGSSGYESSSNFSKSFNGTCSLIRYRQSSQSFTKDKRPIHFKFCPE